MDRGEVGGADIPRMDSGAEVGEGGSHVLGLHAIGLKPHLPRRGSGRRRLISDITYRPAARCGQSTASTRYGVFGRQAITAAPSAAVRSAQGVSPGQLL
jgi:hypothetical protein